LDRPVTVQEVAPVVVQVCPAFEVTVYPVMARPPLDDGVVHETTDWVLALEVALTPVGAPGTVAGTMAADGLDAGLVPEPLVAVTVKV
jgi:hypothetical protein